ncbi:hypothetical protein Q8F55_004006 [Vanrija albida]|uniref:NAD-dependent epimerase/dehydratase domain-containing protein n=1 Tax=Vanrija albida TaxID=181172 RepID=A0ABR3Q5J2_9TREE
MPSVFITGASGYLGSAITRELVGAGYSVTGLTRSQAGAAIVAANGGVPVRGSTDDLALVAQHASAADATIHTAFDHSWRDVPAACASDRATIGAIGQALEGTGKTFLVSSVATLGALHPTFTEADEGGPGSANPRFFSERVAESFAAKGTRPVIVRIAPLVHGPDLADSSFFLTLLRRAKDAGFAATVGGGQSRWASVHVSDVASLFRAALEKPGVEGQFERYHAVGDNGLRTKDIVGAIAAGLGVPTKDLVGDEAVKHYGILGKLIALDNPVENAATVRQTGWAPTQPNVLEALRAGQYFDQL